MIAITFLLFIIYNYVYLDYTTYIFAVKSTTTKLFFICALFNSFLFFLPIYVFKFQYDYIIMILYLLVFTAELKLFFKQDIFRIFFDVLAFATNFFAIRTIIIGIMALVLDISILELISSQDNRILITAINFLIPIPYISLTKIFFPPELFELLLTSRKNLLFASVILFATYANQIINVSILSYAAIASDYSGNVSISQIRNGLFSLLIFGTIMTCVFMFSKLRLKAINFQTISKELEIEQTIVQELEAASNLDPATSFYIRSVVEKEIDLYIANKVEFFIVFIDIDGLKYVNDVYGHEEGDLYITRVSKEVLTTFSQDLKSRIGGDEFMIVGKTSDSKTLQQSLLKCARKIEQFNTLYNNEYPTSISYGTVFVTKDNQNTTQELIRLADQRMYDFKKHHKKQRVTIDINTQKV